MPMTPDIQLNIFMLYINKLCLYPILSNGKCKSVSVL